MRQSFFVQCFRKMAGGSNPGALDREGTVALMASALNIYMKQAERDNRKKRKPAPLPLALPVLRLPEPLNDADRRLLELYTEATEKWKASYGRLRLIK